MNIPIGKIETAQTYIDQTFAYATKKASEARSGARGLRINKSKTIELKRLDVTKKRLVTALQKILDAFPSFDGLHIFYKELIKLHLDPDQIKKSLASVKWAVTKIGELHRKYIKEIIKLDYFRDVNKKRNEFYGRLSSVLRRIDKHLSYLENARRTIKAFPKIKTNLITGSIVGFPNVGKTTLLTKITTATPEIASYAFTTRRLNLGYRETAHGKVQLIDTPGTLNRFNKMNDIEKLAYLAMKYVSHFYVFVFDLTGTEPIDSQIKLLERINEDFDKDIVVYFSKADLLELMDDISLKKFKKEFKHKSGAIKNLINNSIDSQEELISEIERLSKEI